MPAASYAPSSPRARAPHGAPRAARRAPAPLQAAARVRWDRLGRIAMLFVLVALCSCT